MNEHAARMGALARSVAACLLMLVAAACARRATAAADVLLFDGHGTSRNDVLAVEEILAGHGIAYATADSARLNELSGPDLRAYRLLVVPGGNFVEIGQGLTAKSAATVREAVRDGLGYLGICAGAFFAGASPYNGLNLTGGVRFPFYALEAQGVRKAPVMLRTAAGEAIEVYWEDGPQLSGWGEPVARYPDGTAAVVQGRVGDGWIVLAGVHPEAPDNWRRALAFTTSSASSHAYAAVLVDAALHRRPLPHD